MLLICDKLNEELFKSDSKRSFEDIFLFSVRVLNYLSWFKTGHEVQKTKLKIAILLHVHLLFYRLPKPIQLKLLESIKNFFLSNKSKPLFNYQIRPEYV
jgi:hypothetical protein